MYDLRIEKRVLSELRRYPPKIYKQVMGCVLALQFNPRPHDCKRIGLGYRVDSGEYRIFYLVDDEEQRVTVPLIGQRSDDEIYRLARRLGLL
ncbi:MAG: type II toxin-antitoxin system RelE/ParE family toxin [Chloroflexi bacterium]|nr:type II toxin-antitoxin system RelE/ParE family toxin [Chloroflexota bacterium]